MDCRLRNMPATKRAFGKDITNLERRTKASSISEKSSLLLDCRNKSRSLEKKNSSESKDPITQYQHQILTFMLDIQQKEKIEKTTFVSFDMRQILIDWLVAVHQSFDLKEQTLYLALAYLNQYTSMKEVTKNDYQLVGIACLWIASKFEQIYPPRMRDYIQVTDSSYTETQLKEMEGNILLALNFKLTQTTPLQFLEMVADKWPKESNGKIKAELAKTLWMSKYIIELSLFEGLAKDYCMKTLVVSALMLADSLFKTKSDFKLLQNEKLDRQTVLRCFKEMCITMQNQAKPTLKLKALRDKYKKEKYLCVSKYRIDHR